MLFRRNKRPNVSEEDEAWVMAAWAWLDGILGAVDAPGHQGLILPSRKHYPPTDAVGHAKALQYFETTKRLAGMADWDCVLEPQAPHPDLGSSVAFAAVASSHAAGTFGVSGNRVVVTYDPGSVDQTIQLVATFAHELCHYLIRVRSFGGDAIPGGPEMEEFATDLATVHIGFGLFGANSAFEFKQFTDFDKQGWSTRRLGYLDENSWSFALAQFCELRAIPETEYAGYAKEHLVGQIREARAYLARRAAKT